MGWMDKLLSKTLEKQVKSHTRATCQAMTFAAMRLEREGGFRTYADLAARALELRPGWERIEGMTFKHKGGQTLKIDASWSVASVTREVVIIETNEFVGNLAHDQAVALISQAFLECNEYFAPKSKKGSA